MPDKRSEHARQPELGEALAEGAVAQPFADASLPLPSRCAGPPRPLDLAFPLKPVSSADAGVETPPDGRMKYWIRRDIVRGVFRTVRSARAPRFA